MLAENEMGKLTYMNIYNREIVIETKHTLTEQKISAYSERPPTTPMPRPSR